MVKKLGLIILGLSLLFLASGCNAGDGQEGDASGQGPTPNLTMTAVFAPTGEGVSPQGGKPTVDGSGAGVETIVPGEGDSGGGIDSSGDQGMGAAVTTPTPLSTLMSVPTQTPLFLEFPQSSSEESTPPAPVPSIMAFYQESVPQIDGDPGDWSAVWYALTYVVHGPGYRADDADLSAEAKLGWDQDFLYIGIVVRDTLYVQNSTGSQIWRGDSVEMLIDTNIERDLDSTVLTEDDYQLGFSPGQPGEVIGYVPEAFVWAPAEKVGRLDRVVIAARMTEDGYLMEIAVPWFIMEVVPSVEQQFRFLLSVSDNDDINNDAQQSVVSFAPVRLLHDPTTWQALVLQP